MATVLRVPSVALSNYDRACLDGGEGHSVAQAMNLLVSIANAMQATRLIDVEHCHLVGSYYAGNAGRKLLKGLLDSGARVRVPTTLNASSACLAADSPSTEANRAAATEIVELYKAMGCDAQLTCAPYHLPYRPATGARIAWAESNAVVFANSILGARTNKTVQYLDLCAALTGRIPEYGLYCDEQRAPTCVVDCSALPDQAWSLTLTGELLGLWLGKSCDIHVPLLVGCRQAPDEDLLRALGSAAASAGALSLFHLSGVTPEAHRYSEIGLPRFNVTGETLRQVVMPYAGEAGQPVSAVCLGAPHYSLAQLRTLAYAMLDLDIQAKIPLYVTTSRHNYRQLQAELLTGELVSRGAQLIVDTCSYYRSAIPNPDGPVLTDSAKWAYYGCGNHGVQTLLGELRDCLATAASGRLIRCGETPWV
tara:strand:- start:285726 stop:286991 length:1266 start_codon:yes stop_codon:yes gene_type:complete